MITLAPLCESSLPIAAPIPEHDPETIATLPCRDIGADTMT